MRAMKSITMPFFSIRFWVGLFFLFSFAVNIVVTTPSARADVWGAAIASTLLGQAIETIKTQLKAALLGTLKVAANEIINTRIAHLIGGTTAGNARFVTDWKEFLYTKPAKEVDFFMNDFFAQMVRGKDAAVNYVGVGDTVGNVGGNYPAYLVARGKAATTTPEVDYGLSYDLDEYAPSPEVLFSEGNWQALNALLTNPANNVFGVERVATQVFQQKLEEEREEAKVSVTSPGFIAPKDKDGKVIAPAATIEAMQKDALNIGNTMMAAATEPGEFLAGVMGAVINRTITNIIQNGVGKVQKNIQKEIKAVDAKINKKLTEFDKKLGPAAKYLKETSQRVDTKVKPYTKPPPAAKGTDNGVYCGGNC